MSKYAENNLRNGETIEIKAKFNPLCVVGPLLWFIVVLVAVILVKTKVIDKLYEDRPYAQDGTMNLISYGLYFFLVFGAIPLIKRIFTLLGSNLVITNKRVLGKVGVLSVHAVDYPIEKVDHVTVQAGAFGNLFHFASLKVDSANSSDKYNVAKFIGVSNANQFKNHLTEAIERHQAEARKAQAEEIARAMGK